MRELEEAAFRSWPAARQRMYDGWVMRFDQGYTKRANSITPLVPAFLPLAAKIDECESIYRQEQLPTIFRLASYLEGNAVLDSLLEQRGYRYVDCTYVLGQDLKSSDTILVDPGLHSYPLAEWLAIYYRFRPGTVEHEQPHREILQRIDRQLIYAVLQGEQGPSACGLGVLDKTIFGLFDIVTDPEQRLQGHGTRLVDSMLDWARLNGAERAYLQVVASNQGARRLYAKLGFQSLYHYWYRVQAEERR